MRKSENLLQIPLLQLALTNFIETSQPHQRLTFPQDIAQMAWELMSDVWESALAKQVNSPPYAVKVEILTYPYSSQDYTSIHSLLSDAAGGFARISHQLDTYRAMTMGLFDYRFIREAFALGCLVPGLSPVLQNLNSTFKRENRKNIPNHVQLIGKPHKDGMRFLTSLVSDRDTLITEVYHQNKWIELPLTTHTLLVFPSEQLSKIHNIISTTHRVHVGTEETANHNIKPNTTLSLAVIPHSIRFAPG